MQNKKKLGAILREKDIISEITLDRTLAKAKRQGKRLGALLEETGLVTGEEIADALAIQYGCRVVAGFYNHSFSPDLLRLIPADVALQNMLFPLKIEGTRLALAMSDPTNTKIVSNIAANNGLTIIPFIATRKDIIAAISKHYLGKDFSEQQDKTLLLAEDDALLATMLGHILSKDGYRIITAPDGMEAYKLAISEAPQVIIADKSIPKLNGYGLFDALKNFPDTRIIPVILIADNSDPEEEARAFEKGFFDFLFKPVKDVTLKTRVKRAFQFYEHEYRL
jgi:CheY-like chemotaxis protein